MVFYYRHPRRARFMHSHHAFVHSCISSPDMRCLANAAQMQISRAFFRDTPKLRFAKSSPKVTVAHPVVFSCLQIMQRRLWSKSRLRQRLPITWLLRNNSRTRSFHSSFHSSFNSSCNSSTHHHKLLCLLSCISHSSCHGHYGSSCSSNRHSS